MYSPVKIDIAEPVPQLASRVYTSATYLTRYKQTGHKTLTI